MNTATTNSATNSANNSNKNSPVQSPYSIRPRRQHIDRDSLSLTVTITAPTNPAPASPTISVASVRSLSTSSCASRRSSCNLSSGLPDGDAIRFFQADEDGAEPISLQTILADEVLSDCFARFLDGERSGENLQFYRAVQALKSSGSLISLDDILAIHDQYICTSAPLQVNLSSACHAAIVRDLAVLKSADDSAMEKQDTNGDSANLASISCGSLVEVKVQVMERIFDRALREVTELLCLDKLHRFIQSALYQSAYSECQTELLGMTNSSLSADLGAPTTISSATFSSSSSSSSDFTAAEVSCSPKQSLRKAAAKVFQRLTPNKSSRLSKTTRTRVSKDDD